MAKIQIKNSFITSSAQITISSSLVRFSDQIRAKGITGSFSGSVVGSNIFTQGGNSFGTTALLGTTDNQVLAFETNNSEKMRIATDGNVGIGTTSPAASLEVVGTGVHGVLRNTSNTGYTTLRLYNDQNNIFRALSIDYAGSSYSGALITNGPTGESADIATTGAYPLVLGTNNTARMTILSGGSIGIGTSSPLAKLHVSSSAAIANFDWTSLFSAPTVGLLVANNSSDAKIRIATLNSNSTHDPYLNFLTSGGQNWSVGIDNSDSDKLKISMADGFATNQFLTIDNNGNVGIGTSNPSANLSVNGEIYASSRVISSGNVGIGTTNPGRTLEVSLSATGAAGGYLRLRNPNTTINTETGIEFFNTTSTLNTDAGATIRAIRQSATNTSDLTISTTANSNLTEKLRITSTGNVGIGTSSPAQKLDVVSGSIRAASAANSGEIYFGNNNNASTGIGLIRDNNYDLTLVQNASSTNQLYLAGAGNVYVSIDSNNNETDRAFIVQNNAIKAGTELFRVTEGGLVGIGTSGPSYQLDIYKTTNDAIARVKTTGAGAYLWLDSATDGYFGTVMFSAGTGKWFLGGYGTSDLQIKRGAADTGTEVVRITTTGNVGIGTTNPNTLLHLYSSASNILRFTRASADIFGFEIGNSIFGLYDYTNSEYRWRAYNRNLILNESYGNVGIGTTSPTAKLYVTGSASVTALQVVGQTFINNVTANTSRNQISINANGANYAQIYDIGISAYNALAIGGSSTITTVPSTPIMVWGLSSGNVGIGTSNPDAKLRVIGNVRATSFTGSFSGSVVGTNMFVQGGNSFGTTALLGTNDNQALTFETNGSEKVRITTGGNVGIGTTSPISKLNAYASGSNLSVLKIDGGNGTLFEVTDQLSGSLFSVNDITGLPIIEAFSNYNVIIDKITVGRGRKDVTNSQPLSNTAVGYQALNSNTIGIQNTAVGYASLAANTTGNYNSAFGYNSLLNNTIGQRNTAVGYKTLQNNTTGNYNTATGFLSLVLNTTGQNNSAFGYQSLGTNIVGSNNTAFGVFALASNTTNNNTAVGTNALKNNTIGTLNNAFGLNALASNTTGNNNNAFGYLALASNLIGSKNNAFGTLALSKNTTNNNSAFGYLALSSNTLGANNAAFGSYALSRNTIGNNTTAVGYKALFNNTTASNNVAVGYAALLNNTSGQNNTSVGYAALLNNTTGVNNSAFGLNALRYNTTNNNNAFGYKALQNNTTGYQNAAFGTIALASNTIGTGNSAFGNYALSSNTTGSSNSAFGRGALNNNTIGTSNTAVGVQSLIANTTGSNNSAFGQLALASNTVGQNNNAFGLYALQGNVTTNSNNAFGRGALRSNTVAGNNAFGYYALNLNVNGLRNSAFGNKALQQNSTNNNSAFGYLALSSNTVGSANSAFGTYALASNTTGVNNSAFGFQALKNNTTGVNNTAMGLNALNANNTGTSNTAIGVNALGGNTSGSSNTAVGRTALQTNQVGSSNSAFGYYALKANTTNNNNAFGRNALLNNTTGTLNAAFGGSALASNTIGNKNSAFGTYALQNNTTDNNSAFGYRALASNTTGTSNTAMGMQALRWNTIGTGNVAFGHNAMPYTTNANYNSAFGFAALFSNSTGSRNSAVGTYALFGNTSGTNNIAIGYGAGDAITTGNKNIIIGYNIDAPVATGNNQLNIANLIFGTGSFGEGTTVTTGSVGIGFKTPTSTLHLYGSGSNKSVFKVDGGNGTLFEITDNLSGSLFSVNTIAGIPVMEVFSNNRVVMGTYGSNALVVSGSNVGIGTATTGTYKLQVNGSFGATSKSFLIKHPDPSKSDKYLQHGVTEAPEHTVFVRGKLTNNNTIELPDYWPYLVDDNTITVTITPVGSYQQLYVQSIQNNTVTIANNNNNPIHCYYYVVGERKDIPKLIVEL